MEEEEGDEKLRRGGKRDGDWSHGQREEKGRQERASKSQRDTE